MATSNGNCFICGKTSNKTSMKNHIFKDHNSGDERCYLIKAEGAYDKYFWLFFSVPLDAPLSEVDKFLREIWCECCGHMSGFSMGGSKVGKSTKLSVLSVGDKLLYEYDFGSTTEIIITLVEKISRTRQKNCVQLLARNVPPNGLCVKCKATATYIDPINEYALLCDNCASEVDDEECLLPITNSPRCGECGYEGEMDIWEFFPNEPFPQP